MNEFDPALAIDLDRLAPSAAASSDWSDVLARAGHRRHPVGLIAAAVLVLLVALLATPALGIRGTVGEILGVRSGPRVWTIKLVAELTPVAGSGSGTFVTKPLPSVIRIAPNGPPKWFVRFSAEVSVTVRFRGLSGPATVGRIRVAPPRGSTGKGFVVRLCGPCSSGTTIVVHRRGLIAALVSGRGTAEIATAAHPGGELRGRLHTT